MTVIRRPPQTYNYPNSNTASDTESLHLGSGPVSDSESLNNETIAPTNRPFRPPAVRVSNIEELVKIKKSSGRKKLRRYQDRCILQTLNEEEENEGTVIIMESYKSPFSRLLEDDNALEFWNNFIEKTEEEQTKIVQAFSEKYYHCTDQLPKTDKPFSRISSRLRRTIKIRKNLPLEVVKNSEEDLIDFFKATPAEVYIKFPPTSFDRLLLHAIAQYHNLKSTSVVVEDVKRSVEISNFNDQWSPAECFLTDFIAQLRS